MKIIDSHCHLHDSEFYSDEQRAEIHQRNIEDGVGVICVATDEKSAHEAVNFAQNKENVWAAIGVHPHEAKHGWSGIEEILKTKNTDIVAVGEIGLDYFYNHSSRDEQIKAFEAQMQLAMDYDLPVSFHVRDGFDDFWPIYDNFPKIRGVLHSFTDTQENLEKGFERGLFVGINGISTFTKDRDQQVLYENVPMEKMLIETDAPFLTPLPLRGKMNEPGYVRFVAEFWAKKRNVDLDDFISITVKNTRQLFGI